MSHDINIPFAKLKRHRQSTGYFCGPAAMQMLLSIYDVTAGQSEIAKAGSSLDRVGRLGMSSEELARATHVLAPNLAFWVKRDSSLSDIEMIIKKHKVPVGIDWQGIFEEFEYGNELNIYADDSEEDDGSIGDQGHYVVVVDIDTKNGFIRLADPYGHYSGKDRFIPLDEFEERWWDDLSEKEGGIRKYTFESKLMFLVVPKNEMWPEELGMKSL